MKGDHLMLLFLQNSENVLVLLLFGTKAVFGPLRRLKHRTGSLRDAINSRIFIKFYIAGNNVQLEHHNNADTPLSKNFLMILEDLFFRTVLIQYSKIIFVSLETHPLQFLRERLNGLFQAHINTSN
jgi:hypothetical protein